MEVGDAETKEQSWGIEPQAACDWTERRIRREFSYFDQIDPRYSFRSYTTGART